MREVVWNSKHSTEDIVGGLCPLPMVGGDKALAWLLQGEGRRGSTLEGTPSEPWLMERVV